MMKGPVICIGASLLDEIYTCKGAAVHGTSNPADVRRSAGGVMNNVARLLGLMQVPVRMITVLGDDTDRNFIHDEFRRCNVSLLHEIISAEPTGKYVSILNPDGSLFTAACSDISHRYLNPEVFGKLSSDLSAASAIIADTNISEGALEWLSFFCRNNKIPFFIETVSVAKARKLSGIDLAGVFMITPNEDELDSVLRSKVSGITEKMQDIFSRGVRHIWLRKGSRGSELFYRLGSLSLDAIPVHIVDSTGAGDAALAGWVAGWYGGKELETCMKMGHALAAEMLQQKGAMLPSVEMDQLLLKYYPDAK